MARRPVPREWKVLTGSKRARTTRESWSPPRGVPPCPPEVEADRLARAEWERLVPALAAHGVLRSTDWAIAAIYCLTYADMLRWMQARESLIAESSQGIRRHPADVAVTQLRGELRRLLAELGLTPASRARVGTPPPADEDPFAAFDTPQKS